MWEPQGVQKLLRSKQDGIKYQISLSKRTLFMHRTKKFRVAKIKEKKTTLIVCDKRRNSSKCKDSVENNTRVIWSLWLLVLMSNSNEANTDNLVYSYITVDICTYLDSEYVYVSNFFNVLCSHFQFYGRSLHQL